MTTTFDESLPTARDRARLALGDTEGDLLEDETYDALIAAVGESEGIARLAEGLATRFGQQPSQVRLDSGLQVSWADRVKAWLELAARMRSIGNAETAADGSIANVVRVKRRYEYDDYGEYVRPHEHTWWTDR